MGGNSLRQGTTLSLRKVFGILILLLIVGFVAGKPAMEQFLKDFMHDNTYVVYFPRGTAMGEDAAPVLEQVESFMKGNGMAKAEINGYTNPRGDAQANLELSQKRADLVKAALAGRGINESRLVARGFGGSGAPVVKKPGESDTAWQMRMSRVEIKIKLF